MANSGGYTPADVAWGGSMVVRKLTETWRGLPRARRRTIVGLFVGAALSVASAAVADGLATYFGVYAPNMIFLCSVILAALGFGRHVGLATALFAFFVYNYYLTEPHNAFGFAGFNDVLTLFIFVSVALMIGGLAGTLHDERDRAREQVRILSSLFAASRSVAESSDTRRAMEALVEGVRQLGGDKAIVYEVDDAGRAKVIRADPPAVELPAPVREAVEAVLHGRDATRTDDAQLETASGWRLQPTPSGGKPFAVLAWKPGPHANTMQHAIAVGLMCELTQVAFERTQAMQRKLAMDTFAATERLRTALMSSISHDFRTPLSTILTSASSLATYGDQFSNATRADLLTTIQEEAERLNRFIGNILDMTRLEAGVIKPKQEWTDPLEVIENVHDRVQKRLGSRSLTLAAPAAVPTIRADPLLLEQAMINAVDNALVHTPPNSAIKIGADYCADAVRLWVEDNGPGVAASELESIFDKFERARNVGSAAGVGLGLAISKGFIEAMDGTIRAASPVRDGRGLRIEFDFPAQAVMERG